MLLTDALVAVLLALQVLEAVLVELLEDLDTLVHSGLGEFPGFFVYGRSEGCSLLLLWLLAEELAARMNVGFVEKQG